MMYARSKNTGVDTTKDNVAVFTVNYYFERIRTILRITVQYMYNDPRLYEIILPRV